MKITLNYPDGYNIVKSDVKGAKVIEAGGTRYIRYNNENALYNEYDEPYITFEIADDVTVEITED